FAAMAADCVDVPRMAAALSFWVFTFPDVLCLNQAACVDTQVARLLAEQRRIDTGHEKWYLHDYAVLHGRPLDRETLTQPGLLGVREASYRLVVAAMQAETDVERLALVQGLEAAGDVFFAATEAYFARSGLAGRLRYFSGIHRDLELTHADQMDAVLAQHYGGAVEVVRANAMRTHVFAIFRDMMGCVQACASPLALA
ncbi:MAG TPA: hypothetical protein VIT92_00240, partial [Burkholderiaceae bacterium]